MFNKTRSAELLCQTRATAYKITADYTGYWVIVGSCCQTRRTLQFSLSKLWKRGRNPQALLCDRPALTKARFFFEGLREIFNCRVGKLLSITNLPLPNDIRKNFELKLGKATPVYGTL